MKKGLMVSLLGGALMLASGCHKKMHPTKTAVTVTSEQKEYTPAQLAKGEEIFRAKCGKCHELHEPGEFTTNKWGRVLPIMTGKARLAADEAAMVTAWINKNAKS